MSRLGIVAALAAAVVLGVTVTAWAALGGILVAPDWITGAAQGGGSASCQSSAMTFTFGDPSWDNPSGEYVVGTLSYSGLDPACVNLGTADLKLAIVGPNGQSLDTETVSNMSSSSGTINLGTPISADQVTNGITVQYLVMG